MAYLSVTNFHNFQHYRNRKPPWIKFYVALLDPKNKLNELPVSTRYLFDRMLLLAAEWDNAIPNDYELIAKLVVMDKRACREGLDQLLKGRWLSRRKTRRRASKRDSSPLADLHVQSKRESKKELHAVNGSLDVAEQHVASTEKVHATVVAALGDAAA